MRKGNIVERFSLVYVDTALEEGLEISAPQVPGLNFTGLISLYTEGSDAEESNESYPFPLKGHHGPKRIDFRDHRDYEGVVRGGLENGERVFKDKGNGKGWNKIWLIPNKDSLDVRLNLTHHDGLRPVVYRDGTRLALGDFFMFARMGDRNLRIGNIEVNGDEVTIDEDCRDSLGGKYRQLPKDFGFIQLI